MLKPSDQDALRVEGSRIQRCTSAADRRICATLTPLQVLLFNFFEDSSVDVSQWRVVLNGLSNLQADSIPAPVFDENKHAGVCLELKFLYVAVTRARKNLWIVDSSERGGPMLVCDV